MSARKEVSNPRGDRRLDPDRAQRTSAPIVIRFARHTHRSGFESAIRRGSPLSAASGVGKIEPNQRLIDFDTRRRSSLRYGDRSGVARDPP